MRVLTNSTRMNKSNKLNQVNKMILKNNTVVYQEHGEKLNE